jgi:predicted small lipoprotein YifL
MTPNRIMRGAAARRALLLSLAALVAALALTACGSGGGGGSTADAEKAADAEILNEILSRQTAAVAAYDHSLRGLGGQALATARLFRAQEQEHVDAILKALRSLGEEAEPAAETIDADGLKTEAEYLTFLYELESATIDAELSAIARLTTSGNRALLAATVANQAQHLVLIRRLFGAKPLETVPVPFETGTTPGP